MKSGGHMKDGSAALLANAPLDPKKLPNYVYGMVLGPSDFRQVLENFDWKHRNANQLLHGAGTVCGLKVSSRLLPGGTDVEIVVASGFAISPRGRWIRIDQDQCAPLNQWLHSPVGSLPTVPAPGTHTVYVTLCYHQCLTDLVPIAGQQCAPDASNRAPSRILESFRLQFSSTPPAQPLEDRARLFGILMRRIVIVDAAASLPSADDSQAFLDAVHALAQAPQVGSLPGSLPSALPDSGPIRLASPDADATIREAMTIWVTEVCPSFRSKPEASPLLDPAIDDCLLLAAVNFTVASNGQVNLPVDSHGALLPGAIAIDETERPVLVPTRILQELFPSGSDTGSAGQEEMTGTLLMQPPSATWPQFTTVHQPLPAYVPPDALIELSIESSNPPLLDNSIAAGRNVALTLVRPTSGSLPSPLSVAATYLSVAPSFISITVRWRWYRG
jgi:hypothetical protein